MLSFARRSGHAVGCREETQERKTIMAVIHPEDRLHASQTRGSLHPAVGLAVGFGAIVAVATAVHLLFGVLF